MTILTVDDLARDLKVKNEDLLKELVTMGYEVDGPESSLITDDPAALRTHLVSALPQREVVEKRIRPTVIRRRTKNTPVQEFQEESTMPPETVSTEFEEPYETTESPSEAPKTNATFVVSETKKIQHRSKRHEPARIIEMAPPKPPVRQAPSVSSGEKVSPRPAAPRQFQGKRLLFSATQRQCRNIRIDAPSYGAPKSKRKRRPPPSDTSYREKNLRLILKLQGSRSCLI